MNSTAAQAGPLRPATRAGHASDSAISARNSTEAPMASAETGKVG